MVKMLTVLVSTISNSQVFLLKATHIFSAKIFAYNYAIFNDQSFNNTLINDIVSFEQLGPDDHHHHHWLGFVAQVVALLTADPGITR